MMKLKKLFFIILFPINICFSQIKSVEVEYLFKILTENSEEFLYKNKLIANENCSIYGVIDSTSSSNGLSNKYSIFFDNDKDEILYENPIFNKDFYILEEKISEKIDWKLTEDTKEILGYECKSAKMRFRGRNYTAFYCEDILFYYGPFKFNGLPGLIFEIYTDDYKFHFIANKLNLKLENVEITNPYKKVPSIEFISFADYKKLFLTKLKLYQQKIQSEEKDDTEYNVNDQSIELNE